MPFETQHLLLFLLLLRAFLGVLELNHITQDTFDKPKLVCRRKGAFLIIFFEVGEFAYMLLYPTDVVMLCVDTWAWRIRRIEVCIAAQRTTPSQLFQVTGLLWHWYEDVRGSLIHDIA